MLIRHAEAEPQRLDDRTRVLTPRGRSDATALRRWLLEHDLVPDHVLVSDAARTRETWELADPGAAPATYDERVYAASADDLRDLVARLPDDVDVVAVVGHNPAVERLAWELDPTDQHGMSPGAVVVLEVDDWQLGGARLQHQALPRG